MKYLILISLAMLVMGVADGQEQWEIDQANGKYWNIKTQLIETYDPRDDTPGTLKVLPKEGGNAAIEIHTDLTLELKDTVDVSYYFNGDSVNRTTETWDINGFGLFVLNYVVASNIFVDKFLRAAMFPGSINLTITNKEGDSVEREFIFNGFPEAYNELASDLGLTSLDISTQGSESNNNGYMFSGWKIARGQISRTLGDNNSDAKIVVVGKSGLGQKPEIRFYPATEFTRNGETRVRGTFDDGFSDYDEYDIWATVLEQDRFGYIVFPDEEFEYYRFEQNDSYTIELIDRNDSHVTRTFDISNLKAAFDEMREEYLELEIGWDGNFFVRFNVEPSNTRVVVEQGRLLRSFSIERDNIGAFTADLKKGAYRYSASLPDYFESEKLFAVPGDVIQDIKLKKPTGQLGEAIENGYITAELFGRSQWPLKVDEGQLLCESPDMAMIEVNDTTYALNRAAEDLYPSLDPLLADNFNLDDVRSLSERALNLCFE